MKGSNVAEQLQRYSTIPRLTCVSLCEESKTVKSAAVKPEEIGQGENEKMLEGRK